LKSWRDFVYVLTVSVTCAGGLTALAWGGVALINKGYTWGAIFLWLVVLFWLYEVSTNE